MRLHNMQIHSTLSRCASDEMTMERIISEAEKAGLETIGISDHIDNFDPSREQKLLENFSIRDKLCPNINVQIGCEVSQIDKYTIAIDVATAKKLDFVLVASNHYHLSHVENPIDRNPSAYAQHHLKMIEGAIDWGHTTIIPHPFLLAKVRGIDHSAVLASYDKHQLSYVLSKAAKGEVAFELNPRHLGSHPAFFKALVTLGQKVGVKFALGTDAHKPNEIKYNQTDLKTLNQIGVCQEHLLAM